VSVNADRAGRVGQGLIVALSGLGILAFDLPSGWLVGGFGETSSSVIGTAMLLIGTVLSAQAGTPPVLGAATRRSPGIVPARPPGSRLARKKHSVERASSRDPVGAAGGVA